MASAAALDAASSVAKDLNVGKMTDAVVERPFFSFGSGPSTHVANGYHLPIIASVTASVDIPAEHVVIPPEDYFKFVPNHSKCKTAYVTVIAVDEEGNKVLEIQNVPKEADFSVMMNSEGHLVNVKYGKIWQLDVAAEEEDFVPPLAGVLRFAAYTIV